ncbi:MAG: hypothetical protein BGO61_06630 [Thiobacillus sp. 65-69]|nr:MAG: hypothetical protein ABT21_02570 [Thiobacillus sp. SCN 65-179]OJW35654.1 MAG: hypothetical protein BGO61_06630 [Thiobacillus sp. 65-69]
MSGKMMSAVPGSQAYVDWIDSLLDDPRHGWSIGSFGAVGEFIRDPGEPLVREATEHARSLCTPRAAIRVRTDVASRILAYDTLAGDGMSWGHALAFCMPRNANLAYPDTIVSLGVDLGAVRAEDRDAWLFDLGVSVGHVRFCLRTHDARLRDHLLGAQNRKLFGPDGRTLMEETLRAQPHRVLLSPLGRIEVFAAIPPADGESPDGPHTHLLPALIKSGRTHDANAPIPAGFQPVLMFNPRSPWRDGMGRRVPFDADLDRDFLRLLDCYGLPEEARIRSSIESAIESGVQPLAFTWPRTRRGRAVARLTLRRIVQRRPSELALEWRAQHDRAEME